MICKRPKISILIPFTGNNPHRKKVFKWLLKYWKHELPDAEIIIGRSKSKIFCKNEALNNAFRKSKGRVIVILDADAYMDGRVLEEAADKILENLDNKLWLVPYRSLYRLNEKITSDIIASNPKKPLKLHCPPPCKYLDDDGSKSEYGSLFGAMCQMFPREAIETLGCFNEAFVGWGSEDCCLLRSLDTLWGKHKTLDECIFHLWHPYIGATYEQRRWEGQNRGNANERLGNRYNRATGKPSLMREIVDDGCKKKRLR